MAHFSKSKPSNHCVSYSFGPCEIAEADALHSRGFPFPLFVLFLSHFFYSPFLYFSFSFLQIFSQVQIPEFTFVFLLYFIRGLPLQSMTFRRALS